MKTQRVKVWSIAALALVGAVLLGACGQDDRGNCSLVVNGVLVFQPPIDAVIRNRAGRGLAIGATVTARNSSGEVSQGKAEDTLHVFAGSGAGTFEVHVSKQFYRDTTIANVVVSALACGGVKSATLPVTLDLVAGAPPVRSVAVLGADFLATPGSQVRFVPYFDADSGVSTAVSWRISDTTLARIDAGGTVTAKCSTHGGADTVTAISAADTTVRGRAVVGVGVVASCP